MHPNRMDAEIERLEAQLATVTAERDRYRTALLVLRDVIGYGDSPGYHMGAKRTNLETIDAALRSSDASEPTQEMEPKCTGCGKPVPMRGLACIPCSMPPGDPEAKR
jgi:hypothetical protein